MKAAVVNWCTTLRSAHFPVLLFSVWAVGIVGQHAYVTMKEMFPSGKSSNVVTTDIFDVLFNTGTRVFQTEEWQTILFSDTKHVSSKIPWSRRLVHSWELVTNSNFLIPSSYKLYRWVTAFRISFQSAQWKSYYNHMIYFTFCKHFIPNSVHVSCFLLYVGPACLFRQY